MITVHRTEDRQHIRRSRRDVWLTLPPQSHPDPSRTGFAALERLREDRLPPGAGPTLRPPSACEIITYVLAGSILMKDSTGHSSVVLAGEFQRTAGDREVRHGEGNTSRTEWAHVFQVWLHPPEASHAPDREQRRFSAAERRGVWRMVAAPDGREGSLRVRADARIYSAILGPGQHLVHELPPRRCAWLHVVLGAVRLGETALTAGDGVGITAERGVSLTAAAAAEVLLIDLSEPNPGAGEQPSTPDPSRPEAPRYRSDPHG